MGVGCRPGLFAMIHRSHDPTLVELIAGEQTDLLGSIAEEMGS